jgi:8-oxo-dGTP diphosphatase
MRKGICAVSIKDNKILLVKKQKIWILPGGKPEKEESDIQCLVREINKEELPGTKLKNIQFYQITEGLAPHKKDVLQIKVYFANIIGEINPSAEIKDAVWTKNPETYRLSDITNKIVISLRKDGHL